MPVDHGSSDGPLCTSVVDAGCRGDEVTVERAEEACRADCSLLVGGDVVQDASDQRPETSGHVCDGDLSSIAGVIDRDGYLACKLEVLR